MTYYTNEASLKAQYGDHEAAGLMQDVPGTGQGVRLEKAAGIAFSDVNAGMAAAGYVIPLTISGVEGFTPFGEEQDADNPLPFIDPKIQWASDALTAYYLAASTDLQKKRYDEDKAAVDAWFLALAGDSRNLLYDATLLTTGKGEPVVVARDRVFTQSLATPAQYIRRWWFGRTL